MGIFVAFPEATGVSARWAEARVLSGRFEHQRQRIDITRYAAILAA